MPYMKMNDQREDSTEETGDKIHESEEVSVRG